MVLKAGRRGGGTWYRRRESRNEEELINAIAPTQAESWCRICVHDVGLYGEVSRKPRHVENFRYLATVRWCKYIWREQ